MAVNIYYDQGNSYVIWKQETSSLTLPPLVQSQWLGFIGKGHAWFQFSAHYLLSRRQRRGDDSSLGQITLTMCHQEGPFVPSPRICHRRPFPSKDRVWRSEWWLMWCQILAQGAWRICRSHHVRRRRHQGQPIHGFHPPCHRRLQPRSSETHSLSLLPCLPYGRQELVRSEGRCGPLRTFVMLGE